MTELIRPFQNLADASRTTGFSQYWLRQGCRNGTVPHVKNGAKYMVNVPALLAQYGVNSEAEK